MRATLKKWGIVFWEWLITGVAFGLGVLLVAALFLGICASFADAAQAQTVTIPRAAYQHRDTLIRASRAVWGLDAPVSIFAAQIHTESWWKNSTVSSAGAQGLAQFMPSTAKWLPTVAPEVGAPAPFNPGWALRACVTYDKYLWDRLAAKGTQKKALTPCNRMTLHCPHTTAAWGGRTGIATLPPGAALIRIAILGASRRSTRAAGRRRSAKTSGMFPLSSSVRPLT